MFKIFCNEQLYKIFLQFIIEFNKLYILLNLKCLNTNKLKVDRKKEMVNETKKKKLINK